MKHLTTNSNVSNQTRTNLCFLKRDSWIESFSWKASKESCVRNAESKQKKCRLNNVIIHKALYRFRIQKNGISDSVCFWTMRNQKRTPCCFSCRASVRIHQSYDKRKRNCCWAFLMKLKHIDCVWATEQNLQNNGIRRKILWSDIEKISQDKPRRRNQMFEQRCEHQKDFIWWRIERWNRNTTIQHCTLNFSKANMMKWSSLSLINDWYTIQNERKERNDERKRKKRWKTESLKIRWKRLRRNKWKTFLCQLKI